MKLKEWLAQCHLASFLDEWFPQPQFHMVITIQRIVLKHLGTKSHCGYKLSVSGFKYTPPPPISPFSSSYGHNTGLPYGLL